MDLDDELAPLETVQRAVREANARNCSPRLMHSRSSSHDSYFESRLSMGNVGSPDGDADDDNSQPDLSEIQMNFDLEEDEMKIFSEDEAMMTESAVSVANSELDLLANNKSPLAEEFKPLPPPAELNSVNSSLLFSSDCISIL